MEIGVREVGPVTVLDLSGKVTLDQGDSLLVETVDALLEGGTSRRILVNLDQVPYMDSAGIGALVTCFRHAADRASTLKLVNPKKRVYDLLQVVKLDRIFECFDDEQQAVASFGAG